MFHRTPSAATAIGMLRLLHRATPATEVHGTAGRRGAEIEQTNPLILSFRALRVALPTSVATILPKL